MIEARAITPEDLPAFAAVATDPDHAAAVQRHVLDLLARGATRWAWCFLLLGPNGRPLGRAMLRAAPRETRPCDLVLLDLPWHEPGIDTIAGVALKRLLELARELGCEALGHVLDTPAQWPQWQQGLPQRARALERAGFALGRETWRFEGSAELASLPPPETPRELAWHGLPEVGSEAFCAAIDQVSAGSADRRTRGDRHRLGASAQAEALFAHLRRFGHEPEWWELASLAGQRLVGLVVPVWAGAHATIGYIGVVPELRGRGYVSALLARGSATLFRADARLVRGDTDVRNLAMAAAFRRAGFTPFAIRREYARHLDAPRHRGEPARAEKGTRADRVCATMQALRPQPDPAGR